MNIIEAMAHPDLFGKSFRSAGLFKRADTWAAWRAFLKASFALPMDPAELELFQRHTGRTVAPSERAQELWLSAGRRGGKSHVCALLAAYLSAFGSYEKYLAPGETGIFMVLAATKAQAQVIFRYVMALLRGSPILERMITGERAEAVDLSNHVSIEVHAASHRSTRGFTCIGACLDEVAFWRSETTSVPDSEVVTALLPAMSTIPGAMLIGLSTPYARHGVLWERFRDCYGHDCDDVLCWKADSRAMNPTLSESVVAKAYASDALAASGEWGGEFRSDVSAFLTDEMVDAAIMSGVHELAPGKHQYFAFTDPAGGSGTDSYTIAIAHLEGELAVLDACRGVKPPFDPSVVTAEFAALCKTFGCHIVHGDKYAGSWPSEAWQRCGVPYEASELTKSQIYVESLPLFARGVVRVLDNRALVIELRQLERKSGRGADIVDHPVRGHDDYANSACGALLLAAGSRMGLIDVERGAMLIGESAALSDESIWAWSTNHAPRAPWAGSQNRWGPGDRVLWDF